MNKQSISEQYSQEKRTDIVLIMNKGDNKIYGMKGVGKYDEFETAEVNLKNQEQFKLFDKNGSFLMEFLIEFFSSMQNPIQFRFFIVPQSQAVELSDKIQSGVNNSSKEDKSLVQKYELQIDHLSGRLKAGNENFDIQRKPEQLKTPAKSKGVKR